MKLHNSSHLRLKLLVAALLCLSFSEIAAAAKLFTGPINSPAGHYPFALAAGDFDGDGIPDLAVTNMNPNFNVRTEVKILLGNGNGTFEKPVGYKVGVAPLSVAVGDFSGDGKPDLVVANALEPSRTQRGKISVLLGNGDGTFQTQVTYNAGGNPNRVAVADFNGDGKLDLAVTKETKTIGILLGNGDGTFRPQMKIPAHHNPFFIVVGDLNGDGKPDLVVAANAPKYTTTALLGNGDGTFRIAWTISNVASPGGIVLGDFNGDGKLDLAETYPDLSRLTIRLGNGDGTFRNGAHYTFGNGLYRLAAADFSGDGILDIAVVDSFNSVDVFLGRGDGSFNLESSYPLSGGAVAREITAADLNNDGKPDLAVTDQFNGVVSVLLNTGKK